MNEELKYPIKYAILPLKVEGGYAVGYKNITRGFIVSKCYVVESFIKYLEDGTVEISHKVVFPFKEISEFENSLRYGKKDIGEPVIPSQYVIKDPYSYNIVSETFDNYDEAFEVAKEKNEELYYKLINDSISQKNKDGIIIKYSAMEELVEKFPEYLSICQEFERLISLETKQMNITTSEQINPLNLIKTLKK